jgi:rhodanese-related sulfurtransferase
MVEQISRDALKAKIEGKEDFTLLEVLPPWKFRKQHLPGAINLPFNRVEKYAAQRIPNKHSEIVVYCGSFT